MLLMEIFTDPYEWEEDDDNGGNDHLFMFTTDNGVEYRVEIDRNNTAVDSIPLWNVEFGNESVASKNRYGVTGSGNSPQVMTTVMDIVGVFAQTHPGVFTFSAKEPNRAQLYGRMLKRFIKPPMAVDSLINEKGEQVFFVGMPDQVQMFKQRKEEAVARTAAYLARSSVNNNNY